MRAEFAPGLVPSQFTCDLSGPCSPVACELLRHNLSREDKQMAMYVFEQISGLHHTYQSMYQGLLESAISMQGRIPDLMRRFSRVRQLDSLITEKDKKSRATSLAITGILGSISTVLGHVNPLDQAVKKRKKDAKAKAGVGAIAGAVAGVGAEVAGVAAASEAAIIEPEVLATVGIVTGIISLVNSVVGTLRDDISMHTPDLEHNIRLVLSIYEKRGIEALKHDLRKLMEGDKIGHGKSLQDYMTGDTFYLRVPRAQEDIHRASDMMLFGTVVNGLWAWERSYIVESKAMARYGCENDYRGPREGRVCLKDRPGMVYYIYSYDLGADEIGKRYPVHSPTGYRNFFRRINQAHGFTKEDIVLSSLFVRKYKLAQNGAGNYENVPHAFEHSKKNGRYYGTMPGVFTLPICHNPQGEAISSVWTRKSMHLPCMCGDFGWDNGQYRRDKDETLGFLVKTGLMHSDAWGKQCLSQSKCRRFRDSIWTSRLQHVQRTGDPPVSRYVRDGPFDYCDAKLNDHDKGHPEQDVPGAVHGS